MQRINPPKPSASAFASANWRAGRALGQIIYSKGYFYRLNSREWADSRLKRQRGALIPDPDEGNQ